MKIVLGTEYKSLAPFESEELTDLCVITGKNGSGKTQLLQLFWEKSQNKVQVSTINLSVLPNIDFQKMQFEGIAKAHSSPIGYDTWKNKINGYLTNWTPQVREFFNYIIDKKLEDSIQVLNLKGARNLLSNELDYRTLVAKALGDHITADKITYQHENSLIAKLQNINIFINIIKEICEFTGKKVNELVVPDFFKTPIKEHLLDHTSLFTSQIETVFFNYARRRDINIRGWVLKTTDGEKNNSVLDTEFVSKSIPPWTLINNIFETHNIDFYIKEIPRNEFTSEVPIIVELFKKSINKQIEFGLLSSGEKIIIGLILKLFTGIYYDGKLEFPELLLLDEPDAHLHPEMSKLLLDILHETFVKKYGIKVILTTHSPSTIALVPENCIYQLINGNETKLKKISKDYALEILTSFIPTLSIDYRNHKQVFVESPTDVAYYQRIHDRHHQNKKLSSKLYFISNTAGKSNCSNVYKIVKEIRNSGNTTSYGIVDWDLINQPEQYIAVHGYNERYSIENFILDPIYVVCLLIELKNAHNICQSIGVDLIYNQYSLGEQSVEKLAEITRHFFSEFEKKYPSYKYNSEKCRISYYNGKTVDFPIWYLQMKGHDIVTKIKVVFPALAKYTNEGELQNALSIISAKCYPFVPLTTITTIENIG